jgi:hypothetical protein
LVYTDGHFFDLTIRVFGLGLEGWSECLSFKTESVVGQNASPSRLKAFPSNPFDLGLKLNGKCLPGQLTLLHSRNDAFLSPKHRHFGHHESFMHKKKKKKRRFKRRSFHLLIAFRVIRNPGPCRTTVQ